ncbi:MAG: redoxin domain-containing protein [Planctomycetes bacterium]|nr:redoxin domain-containing protein [Planctomycetota bacterium]
MQFKLSMTRRRIALFAAMSFLYLIGCSRAEDAPPVASVADAADEAKAITLRVVDREGQPVAGAMVGDYGTWEKGGDLPELHGFGDPREDIDGQLTDEYGHYKIDAATVALDQMYGPQAAYAIAADRELVGLAELSQADSDGVVEVTMHPWCVVEAAVDSTELAELGHPLELVKCYVYWKDYRPFFTRSTNKHVRFLLPAGKYEFNVYGTEVVWGEDREVEIAPGERTKQLEFDLPAKPLARMLGHEAPELDAIAAWKGSDPLRMADLRGKFVLLEFWGCWCNPCVASMPRLVKLYEEFHDRGLEVIAVHDSSAKSLDELEEKIAPVRKRLWEDRDLPFPIALDGETEETLPDSKVRMRGKMTATYGITRWPTAILIDRQGNVVGEFNYRAPDARSKLQEALGLPVDAAESKDAAN